ncbi:LOW QUALITY PROTEIN: lck-interacting transmembrane adapter 1 [Lynx canadensis]|uniref:LOW QUALITY PROTEIN: lck-interacting transmembrane adapter 1 n=1 Tax=Lynx canadensis TaxID=61383 RepID=UPI0011B00E2E|nr:LOW QUALITY PROTEIN: lck-interacting transmembrane adapter 1 [Lynx canadensis]
MGPQVPSAPPVLWVLGCLALFLWLWTLCTACHRKRVQRSRAGPQGCVMPVEVSLLRQHRLCSLSKSTPRLHELHRGPKSCRGDPRPASVDILHPRWLEVPRGTSRTLTAFSHENCPGRRPAATLPSICPEATYSNVALVPALWLWAGERLTSSPARPWLRPRPGVAEYACIQKLEGTDQRPQSLRQWKAEVDPSCISVKWTSCYSRVKKPKKRDLGPATDQLDPKGRGEIPALGSDQAYETLPLRGLGMDDGLPDNVYETIQEMGAPEHPEPSGCRY